MIYLYKKMNDDTCSPIEDYLRELVAAHIVIEVESPAELPAKIANRNELPVLIDGRDIVYGYESIRKYVEEFELLKIEWDKFQTDACYCDKNGEVI